MRICSCRSSLALCSFALVLQPRRFAAHHRLVSSIEPSSQSRRSHLVDLRSHGGCCRSCCFADVREPRSKFAGQKLLVGLVVRAQISRALARCAPTYSNLLPPRTQTTSASDNCVSPTELHCAVRLLTFLLHRPNVTSTYARNQPSSRIISLT